MSEHGYGVVIYKDGSEFEVWLGPTQDIVHDNIINAVCIGVGATRDEAVSDAVQELEGLVNLLQLPPETIRLTDVTPVPRR